MPVFPFLAGVFLVVMVLIQARVLHYVYTTVGLSSKAALALLLVSLLGSYFNIPIAQMPERELISGQIVSIFGIPYTVPTVVDWPGTIVAVNIGGAVIPGLLSLYLLAKNRDFGCNYDGLCWRGLLLVGAARARIGHCHSDRGAATDHCQRGVIDHAHQDCSRCLCQR
jgi:hypothetical protein